MRKLRHRAGNQGHVVGWFGDQNSDLLDVLIFVSLPGLSEDRFGGSPAIWVRSPRGLTPENWSRQASGLEREVGVNCLTETLGVRPLVPGPQHWPPTFCLSSDQVSRQEAQWLGARAAKVSPLLSPCNMALGK